MDNIQNFDYNGDILSSLLWRHDAASALIEIISDEQDFYNTNIRDFCTNWYDDVFNVETANIFGLNVWAIILRLPITVVSDPPDFDSYFGFNAVDDDNFIAPFYPETEDINLTVEDARLAILLRYRSITTNCSVGNVNNILEDVFGPNKGISYIIDNYDMTSEYVFNFLLSYPLTKLLLTYDILPRPAGVGITLTFNP